MTIDLTSAGKAAFSSDLCTGDISGFFEGAELKAIAHNKEPLSAKEIHRGLGDQKAERSLRNDLLELKAQSLLKMIGSGPGTLWVLIE